MPRFATGVVEAVTQQRAGLQRVVVAGRPAYVLTEVVGPVRVGETVVVNTTAVDRSLGTGGYDVVHWNLANRSIKVPGAGHIMKARYTSAQLDSGTWDTDDGPGADSAPHDVRALVADTVVVGCQLHSHVGALAAAISADAGPTVGYVMTDSAALPMALSDLVAQCRDLGLIGPTASAGQAFGAEYEAVTVPSAVAACVHGGAEMVIVGPGPGHVGTADGLSFSGIDLVGHLDLLAALGARTVLAIRWSSADERERHAGLSHHTGTLLGLFARSHVVPVANPTMRDAVDRFASESGLANVALVTKPVDVAASMAVQGLEVATMGRSLRADTGALAALGAAAAIARQMCGP